MSFPKPVSQPSAGSPVAVLPEERGKGNGEQEKGLIFWYRRAVRFVQNITMMLIRPNQTLREYALESSRKLGPLAGAFMSLTMIVERSLYSLHAVTGEELE